MPGLFSDLRVLDLSSVLAGPAVATFFAELGAQVTKIEHPLYGDVTRSWKNKLESIDAPVSAYYASVNYGKDVMRLDLGDMNSRPLLESMIAKSDIIVTNFKSGDAEKFNLTSEVLLNINPRVIHAKILGFEHQQDRVAYDLVLQAETGMMSMNGTPESGPIKMPVAFIDLFASHQLKEGILCALLERMKTDRGGIVSCSLEAAAMASLANQASNYLMSGWVAKRQGSLHPNIAPYGELFTCKSGEQITLAIGSDRQFADLCGTLSLEALISDERFSTNAARLKHRDLLAKALEHTIAQIDWPHWSQQLLDKHIPFGVIRSLDEVIGEPKAQQWILDEVQDGMMTKRLRTVMFHYEPAPSQQGLNQSLRK